MAASSKTRFHKGLTTVFRNRLRDAGIAIDEELAQRVLSGRDIVSTTNLLAPVVDQLRSDVLGTHADMTRFDRMRLWEHEHPGQRPYPPPFAERVLTVAREAYGVALEEDGNPSYLIDHIIALCRAELDDDPYLPDFEE